MNQHIQANSSGLQYYSIQHAQDLSNNLLIDLLQQSCNANIDLRTIGAVFEYFSTCTGGDIYQEKIIQTLRENILRFSKDESFYELDPVSFNFQCSFLYRISSCGFSIGKSI
jgi:hypothetical protein